LPRNRDVFRFFKNKIAFRRAHPSLSRSRFWREDVRWYGAAGQPDLSQGSRSLAFFLRGASENDQDIYAMINAGQKPLPFVVQQAAGLWSRVIDTSLTSPVDFCEPGDEKLLQDANLRRVPTFGRRSRSQVTAFRRPVSSPVRWSIPVWHCLKTGSRNDRLRKDTP
jgi:glycogen operon protein